LFLVVLLWAQNKKTTTTFSFLNNEAMMALKESRDQILHLFGIGFLKISGEGEISAI
jgi:hypothetical protein